MTPDEYLPLAGAYASVVKRFLVGRPVEITLRSEAKDLNTCFRDGKLHIETLDVAGKHAFMICHELGHIVEATPDELFTRNLGMVDGDSFAATPEQFMAESRVIAWHLNLAQEPRERAARVERVASMVFGGKSGDRAAWDKALAENKLNYTIEAFAERWEKVWETIDARAAVAA